jgi:hypothetical protein
VRRQGHGRGGKLLACDSASDGWLDALSTKLLPPCWPQDHVTSHTVHNESKSVASAPCSGRQRVHALRVDEAQGAKSSCAGRTARRPLPDEPTEQGHQQTLREQRRAPLGWPWRAPLCARAKPPPTGPTHLPRSPAPADACHSLT